MPFTPPPVFTTRPTLTGTFGMTSSTHWIASAVGQSVLERGGNAFDAAVATAFVLHVVEPHLNGPGGDMTAIVHVAGDSAPRVLVGQGPAPARATAEHFAAEGLTSVPGSGALAAAVPAAFDAWLLLLRDHGTWQLADVWRFAIDYARNGHPVLARVVTTIESVRPLFAEHWPSSAQAWLPDGRPPRPGELIRNAPWAATLERLLAESDDAAGRESRIDEVRRIWAEGFVAEAIVRSSSRAHRHSTGTDHTGVLGRDDLAGFRASWEATASVRFRGLDVHKTAAWGQGPALLQALLILDGFADDEIDPSTAGGIHRIIEALKLALADRDAYYGDGDVPLEALLSPEYAALRRALITEEASLEFRPGRTPGVEPYRPPLVTDADLSGPSVAGVGEPTVDARGTTRGDTCHLDVVDRWGNMVAATPSGGWLQSSPHIPELGFALGTRLQMTWLEPSGPSALRPGRRPRTTLTPTLLTRDGVAVSALGSPGGDQQDQWQLIYLIRVIVGGYTPQQAIDAPAFHTMSMPNSFWPRTWQPGAMAIEDRAGDEVIAELERRGHRVFRAGDWAEGRITSVSRDPETAILSAAANPRGMQGYAVGR